MVVAVMVMAMRSNLFYLRERTASMRRLATVRLKLDGRVGDAELVVQPAVDPIQNACALRHWHLRNSYVAGQRVRLRSQAPDMQVVHIQNTLYRLHGVAHGA